MKKYLILFVYTDIIKGDGYRLLNKFIQLKNYQKLKTWMICNAVCLFKIVCFLRGRH